MAILDIQVKRKTLDSFVVYSSDRLKMFFDIMDKENYIGPFSKSIFVTHTDLIDYCERLGITLKENQIDNMYYIIKPIVSNIVLFDPNFIDKAEED